MGNEQDQYRKDLAGCVAASTLSLRSATASERTSQLEGAKRDAEQLRERERSRLKREVVAVESAHARAIEGLEHEAESTRRQRADALLSKALGPDALPALVARWRIEPSRADTAAIQKLWMQLDALARAELGEPLGVHVLAVAYIDSIAAEIPGSLSRLCAIDFGNGVDPHTIEALGAWHRATIPADALRALEAVERSLLVVARRGEGQTVEPHHVELHELRRASATRRDLVLAQEAFAERRRRAEHEAFVASYVAPPPPTIGARVMSWLSPE